MRTLNSSDGSDGSRLLLQADASSGVGILERDLRGLGLRPTGPDRWQTPRLDTSRVSMVGFTWRDGVHLPRIQVRFRSRGGWSSWLPAPVMGDAPDPASGEGIGKAGTVPLVVPDVGAPADGIQVQVEGAVPPELSLTLLHADRLAADARIASEAVPTSGRVAARVAGAPAIYSRAQWGANESWRDGAPRYNSTIAQVHVHHSASGNNYAQADVPGLIRSFYKYHTQSLGWSDIAYNFLIDAYGTIWEGRAGGVDRAVRGAHTLGFNHSSTGLCVIGNLETAQPTSAVIASLGKVAGWKLGQYGRDPQGTVQVVSEGSDKFPRGKSVSLPAIDGHRDTNDTACPGRNLYAQLAAVRSAAATPRLKLKVPYSVSGKTILGRTLTVVPGRFKPRRASVSYQWMRNGSPIAGAVAAAYVVGVEDVAQTLSVVVTGSLPGVAPVQQKVDLPVPVRSVPVCTLRTQRKPGGKVIVHLEVSAPGVAEPDGTAVVMLGARQRTVTVNKGKAIARFVDVPPGRWKVRCKYSRGTWIRPGKTSEWVRVPGRGPRA